MSVARIDYIKFVFVGTYEETMRNQARIGDCCVAAAKSQTVAKQSAVREGDYHDSKRKCHVAWIEISGPAAHEVAATYASTYHEFVNRLDWRLEIEEPNYTYAEMRRAFKQHANSVVTFMEMESRERTKTGKRDAGGQSLYSGAAGSDRRLVYYRRGQESYALEARFLNKMAQRVMQTAINRWMSLDNVFFIDVLTEALDGYTLDLFTERTGMTYEVLTGQEPRAEQIGSYLVQEAFMLDIEEGFHTLDEGQQTRVLTSILSNEAVGDLAANILDDLYPNMDEPDIPGLDA